MSQTYDRLAAGERIRARRRLLGFTKEEQKKEVEAYFAKIDTKGFDQGLAQSLDVITSKANWSSRDYDVIAKWLGENGYKK